MQVQDTSGKELVQDSRWIVPNFIANADPMIFTSKNYLCVDFEIDTSFGDFGHPVHPENQMLLACWSLGPDHPCFEEYGKVYTLWGNEYQMSVLQQHLALCDFWIAHNSKYELGWLKRMDFDINSKPVFCTKIAEYVLSGNLKISTRLDDCVKRRGGRPKDPVVDHMMNAGVNPVDIPKRWLSGRCIQDVETTQELYLDQLRSLLKTNRLGVVYVRCMFTPVLAYMEQQGVQLDKVLVDEEYQKEFRNEHLLFLELEDLMSPYSPGSKVQLGIYLFEVLKFEEPRKHGKPVRTAKGDKYKTDVGTIEKLKATTKEQKAWRSKYFTWNKSKQRLSKYLDFYWAACNQQDGVFYAQFNQTVTATHRLSSSGKKIKFRHVLDKQGHEKEGSTQLQNQPREYKKFFCAKRQGWFLSEEDGSGLEFRVAGMVGNDKMIKEDINDPTFDPHRRSASVKYQVSEDEVTKDQRTGGKEITFMPLFGGESGTKTELEYFKYFKDRYSDLVNTQEKWLTDCINDKYFTLPWGLRFYFPNIKRVAKGGYMQERTQIFNAPIQSFATADIIPIQATIMWHLIMSNGYEPYMKMTNTVHDSVITEVHPGYKEEYKELVATSWQMVYKFIEQVYGTAVLEMMEGIPLGTEIQLGSHWGSGDEFQYEITKDEIRESYE